MALYGLILNVGISRTFLKVNFGILGQVWYLVVSIPDLCTITYFCTIALIEENKLHYILIIIKSGCLYIYYIIITMFVHILKQLYLFVCLFLLLYVPCQQLWSLRDGQFT